MRRKRFNKEYDEVNRKSRVKMHKSGKNWVRVVMSQLNLFRLMKGKGGADTVQVREFEQRDQINSSSTKYLKGLISLGALAGGALITSSGFADEVEATETDAVENGDQVVVESSTVISEEAAVNSVSEVESTSVSLTESTSATETASLSASEAPQTSLSNSEAASESVSNSESVSVSENVPTSESASVSEVASETASTSTSATEAASEAASKANSTATVAAPRVRIARALANNNTSAIQTTNGGTYYDDVPSANDNLLGPAQNFHVFVKDKATLNGHTDGNVATGILEANSNFGTNTYQGQDYHYAKNITSLNQSSGVAAVNEKFVVGPNVQVDRNYDNGNGMTINGIGFNAGGNLRPDEVYKESGGDYLNLDSEFNKLKQTSSQIANYQADATYTNASFPDQNQRKIDISQIGDPNNDGVVVINVDASVLSNATQLRISGINAATPQTVYFNVINNSGAQQIDSNSQIYLDYTDGSTRTTHEFIYTDPSEKKNTILWNFVNADKSPFTGKINMTAGNWQGSILAPAANLHTAVNVDGNIIVSNFSTNAETHRWDFQGEKPKTPHSDSQSESQSES
ncbi:cell surface protein precursor, partial [Streptococcus ratti FA-1 = DSM 20564]